jgi:hypothetical protein
MRGFLALCMDVHPSRAVAIRPRSGPNLLLNPERHCGSGVRAPDCCTEAVIISTEFSTTPPLVPFNVVLVLLVLAGLILLVAAVRLLHVRLRQGREEHRELPPLIYQPRRPGTHRPISRPVGGRDPAAEDQVLFDSTAPSVRIVREPSAGSTDVSAAAPPVSVPVAPIVPTGETDGRGSAAAEGDVTLQLLPGRLEPANPGNRQEIRFIRVPGTTRFTLGREYSSERTHIQLDAVTASRMHAFMVFEGGRWRLGNLSQTNQVVLNGSRLNGDAPRLLEDGDRIEFGELTFVFRAR